MKNETTPLDVTTRGPGEPEIVVVGGIHGDETGGVRAVRRLREADLDLKRGVAFVVANPAAVNVGERYLDSDLNRAFPGNPAGDREERLAAHLRKLVQDRTTLSLHGTHSQPTPFALIHRSQPRQFDLAARMPVPHVVDHWGVNEGAITSCGLSVEIEVGPQGTEEAAVAAEHQADAFLKLVDALPGEPPTADPDFFHMADPIRKPSGISYEVHVTNFESVPAGTTYASVDGQGLITDDPFHPILMSADGYSDIFGYKGAKIADSLERVREILLN
ncbi:succinylglutamate desuccinylase [Natrialba sp. INN-245]|nr:succinylglutamate desuccinylase [Natrialba sp. INN-245]